MSAAASKERVLVVDDEPQVLVALEDLLSDDFIVFKSESAEKAIKVAEGEREIAVVVSDQRMPKMNGDELFANLDGRSDAARILVTGFADLTAVVRAVNSGRLFGYVTKPWNPEDLRLMVHKGAEFFRLAQQLTYERQLLHDLMDNVPDGVYFKDADLRFLRANRACASLLDGGDPAHVVGKRLSEITGNDAQAVQVEADERRVLLEGRPALDVVREHRKNGERLWFSETIAPVRSPSGETLGVVGISRDVTRRIAVEERVARLNRIHAVLGEISSAIVRTSKRDELIRESCRIAMEVGQLALAGVAEVHPDGSVHPLAWEQPDNVFVKLVVAQFTGKERTSKDVMDRLAELRRPLVFNDLASHSTPAPTRDLLDSGYRSLALLPIFVTGNLSFVFTLISEQAHFFDDEEVALLTELARNVSFAIEHAEQAERLNFLAHHDGLTNLPNREFLMDCLEMTLRNASESTKVALVLVDIGRFGQVNEMLGRRGGDQLLVGIAERLRTTVRPQDTLARFHGNTFAVVLGGFDEESEAALYVEEALHQRLREPFVVNGTELRMSMRAGISLFPSDGTDPDALIRNAEAALRNAKSAGQRYMFYAPNMNARVAEKLTLETKLRRAIENEEFLLHYQPKVELRTGLVVGLEALVRWLDPEAGIVPPGQFIPVLEDTGLILEVGKWVMREAARQYTVWLESGQKPPRVAVNVSAIQLARKDFVASIDETIAMYPLAANGLDLEITESVFVDDMTGNADKLRAARDRGLHVALDDFGTGYSSLGYLSRLPIDALKIDRSFVTRMVEDPQDTAIVTTIISLAHALDLKVIAEGVETTQQAQLLHLLKCDQAQGYLMAKPKPAHEVTGLLAATLLKIGARAKI